jgi:fatty-acyl-CoA synthase
VALAAWVAERLAAYKIPARFVFQDELPRTGTGKFDRAALRQRALEQIPASR